LTRSLGFQFGSSTPPESPLFDPTTTSGLIAYPTTLPRQLPLLFHLQQTWHHHRQQPFTQLWLPQWLDLNFQPPSFHQSSQWIHESTTHHSGIMTPIPLPVSLATSLKLKVTISPNEPVIPYFHHSANSSVKQSSSSWELSVLPSRLQTSRK
jgi:hypothetical protein